MSETKNSESTIIPICMWTERKPGDWSTACGKAYTVFNGTPKDSNYRYCPNCGKVILEKPAEDPFGKDGEE